MTKKHKCNVYIAALFVFLFSGCTSDFRASDRNSISPDINVDVVIGLVEVKPDRLVLTWSIRNRSDISVWVPSKAIAPTDQTITLPQVHVLPGSVLLVAFGHPEGKLYQTYSDNDTPPISSTKGNDGYSLLNLRWTEITPAQSIDGQLVLNVPLVVSEVNKRVASHQLSFSVIEWEQPSWDPWLLRAEQRVEITACKRIVAAVPYTIGDPHVRQNMLPEYHQSKKEIDSRVVLMGQINHAIMGSRRHPFDVGHQFWAQGLACSNALATTVKLAQPVVVYEADVTVNENEKIQWGDGLDDLYEFGEQ